MNLHALTLITSVSGFRGTIGGKAGEGLTPIDIVRLVSGYGAWLKLSCSRPKVVIGRDGRITGPSVQALTVHTLIMMGIDIIDADINTTPSIEFGVIQHQADGGIIITASHNPMNWNALKLLNKAGEFLSKEEGNHVLKLAKEYDHIAYAEIEELGTYQKDVHLIERHVQAICEMDLVDVQAIKEADITVAVDPVNSSGGPALKYLLEQLGVKYLMINNKIDGVFAHNPEPLAAHLTDLSDLVIRQQVDLGVSVDPDVDRLALVCEDGEMLNEENTLIAVADYVLKNRPGPVVSNLSSSRGLQDIAERHGQVRYTSAVGEVHVVSKMKEVQAVLGGEGNGGIICPELHYGRDALVGLALFLSYYAQEGKLMSEIKSTLPQYVMSKDKILLNADINPDEIMSLIHEKYQSHPGLNTIDGVKIDFDDRWVHLRKSNTEPIIRIYSEARTSIQAKELTDQFKAIILDLNKMSHEGLS